MLGVRVRNIGFERLLPLLPKALTYSDYTKGNRAGLNPLAILPQWWIASRIPYQMQQ